MYSQYLNWGSVGVYSTEASKFNFTKAALACRKVCVQQFYITQSILFYNLLPQ